jgi:hypothetical protein
LAKQLAPACIGLLACNFTAQWVNEAVLLGANQHEKLSKKMEHWKTSGFPRFTKDKTSTKKMGRQGPFICRHSEFDSPRDNQRKPAM